MPRFAPLIDTVPDELKHREARIAFISYVKELPVSRAVKRRLIVQWAKFVGDVLTAELFESANVARNAAHGGARAVVTGARAAPFKRFIGRLGPESEA